MLNELIGRPACTIELSHLGMPASRVITVAISSMRAARPSPMRVSTLARSSGVVVDQPGKAALAAATAASTSAALPSGIEPMTSPLVES